MQPVQLDLFGVAASITTIRDEPQPFQFVQGIDDRLAVQVGEFDQPGYRRIGAVHLVIMAIGERQQHQLATGAARLALTGPCESGEAHSSSPSPLAISNISWAQSDGLRHTSEPVYRMTRQPLRVKCRSRRLSWDA